MSVCLVVPAAHDGHTYIHFRNTSTTMTRSVCLPYSRTSPTGRCCDCAANARSFRGNQLLASRALPCSGWPAISHLLRLFGRLFLGDRPQLRRGDVRNRPPCGRGFLGLTLQSQQPTSNTFDLFEEVLLPQVVWIFEVNIRYGCGCGCGRGLTCWSGITGKSEALSLG